MARHGSLCPESLLTKSSDMVMRWERAPTGLRFLVLTILVSMLAVSQVVSGDPAINLQTSRNSTLDVTLDFKWTAAESQYCHFRLRLVDESGNSECMIHELENQSDSDDTVAAFTLSQNATQLDFQPRAQVKSARFRLRVQGTPNTRVVIEALDEPRNPAGMRSLQPVREVSLTELIKKETSKSETPVTALNAIGQQASWSLQRAEDDEIRLTGLQAVPVYEPGTTLELAAAVNSMARQASSVLTFHYSIIQVSTQNTVVRHRKTISIDAAGNSEAILISETVPEAAGVYEIRCRLSKEDDRIWDRLRRRESSLLKIGRPFFVVPKSGTTLTPPTNTWQIAGTLRPSESNWSVGQWLPKTTTRFIPSINSPEPETKLEQGQHSEETVSLLRTKNLFQASLPVLSPGTPHKVKLRLPATQNVRLQIEAGGLHDRDQPATKFILSDTKTIDLEEQWRTYTFVHYPTKDDQIWLTNLGDDTLQLESIEVQAGPQHLVPPHKDADELTPSTQHRNTILNLDNVEWVDSLSKDVLERHALDDFDAKSVKALRLWVALNRVCDLARANGMNGIMLPANSGGKTLFQTRSLLPRTDSQDSESNRLATTIRLLADRGLEAHVSLDPDFTLLPVEQALLQQPAQIELLTRNQQNSPFQYNLLHPLVQDSLRELIADLIFQCGQPDHFAGITIHCGSGSHLQPLRQIFDDNGTLAAFAQSLNVTVDPKQLRSWSRGEGRATYETWVLQATNRSYRDLQRIEPLTALNLKMDSIDNHSTRVMSVDTDTQAFKPGTEFPISIGRSHGYTDPPLLVRKALRVPLQNDDGNLADTVFFNTKLQLSGTPLVQNQPMILEDTCHLIDRLDPANLVIKLPLNGRILRPQLDILLHTLQNFPRTGVRSVKVESSAQNTVCVKSVQHDGFLYLACLCLTPWANEIDIETSQPIEWKSVGRNPDDSKIEQLSQTRARIQVSEGRMILLQSNRPATEMEIASCKTRLSGGTTALADIKRKVTLVAQRIGILFDFESYDALNNGGFENSSNLGLVGWLHAQHPAGCVRVDDKQPLEGKHSILLTTEANTTARTWLVSETITPPASGRLAVSLACRAEAGENAGTHRLRVSLEATENGTPVRYSNEFEIRRNGQWGNREVRLEALNINAANMHSLRLTIDSLSSGRVWIDDIRLHDQFPTASERDKLQSGAFLAVQGLQKSNLAPAGRLLQNRWAQHLLKLDPLQKDEPITTEAEVEKEETPGIAERIRDWIPRPLRF
ncbi:hypothetical protein N9B38_00140 [bacterium]|nr:hypothetical protein [bacterium]